MGGPEWEMILFFNCMSRFMITIMKKKDFIVCEGTKELLPAHHKKIMHYLNMMGKPRHVNYVHFISDITIRKKWLKI